jgi:hypothetical protein
MKLFIILSLVSSSIFGATYQTMTELGTSASMIGLGNIHGFEKSSNVIFDNPAGLNTIKGVSAGSFFTELMNGEIQYKNYSIGLQTHVGTFAVGYMGSFVDNIPRTADVEGEFVRTGSFDYRNEMAKLGYAFQLSQKISLGLSIVGMNHVIDDVVGSGLNMDMGAMINVHRLNLNVVIQNALFWEDLSYSNGGTEKIPTTIIGGLQYPVLDDLDAYVQLKTFMREKDQLMSFGLSYQPQMIGRIITLRAGWKEFLIMDKKHTSTTLGIGLDLINIGFDFAYEKSSYFEVDSKNYFSLRFNF